MHNSPRATGRRGVARQAREQSQSLARAARSLSQSIHNRRRAKIFTARGERLTENKVCIQVDGAAAGAIGIGLGQDVHRYTASLGYWPGNDFWGRGIMTEAVAAFTDFCFENFPLRRIYAEVFANNPASARVLEKTGFALEGRLKNNVVKDGELLDSLLYAKTR